MIAQGRGQPTYLLNKNPEMRLKHCHFTYASNIWIIQAFKLDDRIKLSDVITSNSNNNQFSSNLEVDNKEKSEPDIDMHIILALLNKIMKNIKNFYNTYIENKHIKVIKYKTMTLIV